MGARTKINSVLLQGIRYSFDPDYGGSLRALAIKTVNKLDRAEWQRDNLSQIAGHMQVLPRSFDEALSKSVKLRNMAPPLSGDKLRDIRLQRWLTAYNLTAESLDSGNSDNAVGGLKDRAYSTMQDQLADDCYGTGEAVSDSLFNLAVITEILGSDSPWRLQDAKAYWCSLLANVLDMAYSRLEKYHYDWSTDYVLIAMASLARIERRMGNPAAAVAFIQAIAAANPVEIQKEEKWVLVGAVPVSAVDFFSALANPYMFDRINPKVWHTYVRMR
jgi:hypothetical protein